MSFPKISPPAPQQIPLPNRSGNTLDVRECIRERLGRRFGTLADVQRDLHPYDVEQMSALLHRLCVAGILGQRALVSPFVTPPHLAVWSEFFPGVTCLRNGSPPERESFEVVENSRVYDVAVGSTHSLFKFRDDTLRYRQSAHDVIDLFVIEDQRYEMSIVNYFVFKKLLSARRAAVVLVHRPGEGRLGGFNVRFEENLAAGRVDGLIHRFETFINPQTACGFSLELHGEACETNPADAVWPATLSLGGPECSADVA